MNIELWAISKTKEDYLKSGIEIYIKRLKHYIPFQITEILSPKTSHKTNASVLKVKEGESILQKLSKDDFLILLDERGKHLDSKKFSQFIENHMNAGRKKLIFLIGGAYGFSEEVYSRANFKISLSAMTFSHQMIRLFFVEQLYRAFTIIRNEKYHNS